jgi:5-methylcytosine-specific restriction endonuclease McrA
VDSRAASTCDVLARKGLFATEETDHAMTYADKLKDPRWQRRRLEIMQRDNFTCQNCGDNKTTLHVHHKIYVRNADPWIYGDVALVTLCEPCHKIKHMTVEELECEKSRILGLLGLKA